MENLAIYQSYKKSPYLSIKHSSYFQVYTDLLESYRGKPITFVEIGVLNGGSLFMWRDFFGPHARIIGVDFNPGAARWREHGFDIFIGSQSDARFWEDFFEEVGLVDVVLDDGGHRFEQQIITVDCCVPHIREGGLMIVEDTSTSYFKEFGYPTRHSFIEWTKTLIDNINSRCQEVETSRDLPYRNSVYSISIFESIVCFKIQPSRCFENQLLSNGAASSDAQDFRYKGTPLERALTGGISKYMPFLNRMPIWRRIREFAFARYSALIAGRTLRRHFSVTRH